MNFSRGQKIGIAAGVVAALALLILALWFLISNPPVTAAVRDIFIIVLALETIALGVALIVLVLQIYKLMKFLRDELAPIVDNLQETVGTVRGTATFHERQHGQPGHRSRQQGRRLAKIPRRPVRRPRRGPEQATAAVRRKKRWLNRRVDRACS